MARVVWSKESLTYIAQICEYISRDSQFNAEAFLNRMMDSIEVQLGTFPDNANIGRVTPEFSNPLKREIVFEKYRVLYDVKENGRIAYITQVQHGSKPIA